MGVSNCSTTKVRELGHLHTHTSREDDCRVCRSEISLCTEKGLANGVLSLGVEASEWVI